ncbi:Phosphotransferase enzyme family protein [Bythopirellula polymerisocia]|uniref:Phosphotransferase enzyme family protein n=1 Tax=Bythopirellula polymerisocia TaxID=2528003 RepID=A0A5C6CQT5_9BACT|nr:Phosphotransferase enzyme family protein [Bythopirellula polymerisocia]
MGRTVEIHQVARDGSAFQQPVNEQDLLLQLNHVLTNETITQVTELKAGLFNNTYRVNTSQNDYILKVAPVGSADVFYCERSLMQREQSISQQLQSLSPLIPEYLSFFTVDGRDAFLQRWIQGRLWHEVISSLTEAENAELWKQLGAFARILHNCCGEQFGYPAPLEGYSRWSQFIAANVEGMVEDCRRIGVYCEEVEAYRGYLPHFFQTLDQVETAKLLHGDLWPRNVIIDGAGADIHIKAVFDAERAFWGDPASDWVLILYGVPETFWQGYGENLVKTSDPARIAIYKGMYFILNILEAVRFQESDEAPRKRLSAVNEELEEFLRS